LVVADDVAVRGAYHTLKMRVVFDFERQPPVAAAHGSCEPCFVSGRFVGFEQTEHELARMPRLFIGIPFAAREVVVAARFSVFVQQDGRGVGGAFVDSTAYGLFRGLCRGSEADDRQK